MTAARVYASTDFAVDVKQLPASAYLKASWTLANGVNKTFEDADVGVVANEITITGHGYSTGMAVSGLTTTGTLPAGLALITPYWIYVKDVNTIKLATSAANLASGTYVDITAAAGGGTHTVAMASAAGTIKFYYSSNGTSKDKAVDGTGANMASVTSYIEVLATCPCAYIIAEVGVTAGLASITGVFQGPIY